MGESTKIEWTKARWNPVKGSTEVSRGCDHCYTRVMVRRLQAMGQANYRNAFEVILHPHMLEVPLH